MKNSFPIIKLVTPRHCGARQSSDNHMHSFSLEILATVLTKSQCFKPALGIARMSEGHDTHIKTVLEQEVSARVQNRSLPTYTLVLPDHSSYNSSIPGIAPPRRTRTPQHEKLSRLIFDEMVVLGEMILEHISPRPACYM